MVEDPARRYIVLLATAWGPKHGGLNSFNYDLCRSLVPLLIAHKVVCITLSCSEHDVAHAEADGVALLSLNREHDEDFSPKWAQEVASLLSKAGVAQTSIDFWVGHDVKSGALANALAALSGSRSAVIMHMSYGDYSFAKHLGSDPAVAREKTDRQRKTLSEAHIGLAVGPLLFDRLKELRSERSCFVITPGLMEQVTTLQSRRLCAVTFGRFDSSEALVKQMPLAIAGFASAVAEGRKIGIGEFRDAVLHVIGVSRGLEKEIYELAERHGGRVANIITYPFIHDRDELRSRLSDCNLAMMLSWHEGFGLAAWEAIGLGIPLVLTRQSGVYRLLEEIGGNATGCVHAIDVRGATKKARFAPQDKADLRDIILRVGRALPKALADSDYLSRYLRQQRGLTWSAAASAFADSLELPSAAKPLAATTLDRNILKAPNELAAMLDSASVDRATRSASTFLETGKYDNALATIERVEGLLAQLPPRARLRLILLKSEVHVRLGRYAQATRLAQEAARLASGLNDWFGVVKAAGFEITVLRDQGHYSEASALAHDNLARAELYCPDLIASTKRKLARVLAVSGGWRDAIKEAGEALTLSKGTKHAVGQAKALLALGEAYRHGLNQQEALRNYASSRDVAADAGHTDCFLWACLGMSDSLFLVGETDASEELLEALSRLVEDDSQQYPLEQLHTRLSLAAIAHFEGREATDCLKNILDEYSALGIAWPVEYVASVLAKDYSQPKRF